MSRIFHSSIWRRGHMIWSHGNGCTRWMTERRCYRGMHMKWVQNGYPCRSRNKEKSTGIDREATDTIPSITLTSFMRHHSPSEGQNQSMTPKRKVYGLVAIAAGLLWFIFATPLASSGGHSQYLMDLPILWSGWGVIIVVAGVLSLFKGKPEA